MAPQPVVVTGVGVICAAGRDTTDFWTSLMGGRSGIDEATTGPFAEFDARFAGRVPDEWFMAEVGAAGPEAGAAGIDRTAALAMAAAREAFEGAGLDRARPEPARVGLVLGKCQATPTAEGDYQPIHRTADVVAELLGSSGPRVLLSTACAAGGNCIGLARDKLLTGEADVVLAGGVDPLQFGTYAGFAGLRALSTDPCRPYSASTGLNLGEGAAFLVVERLDHARERGATILAEVAGYGLSADAYHATAPDPTGRGGTSAVRRALADAGLGPDDVDYVCGHGTGTPANDAMERKVMRNVFGDRASSVPTSGIKSFLGHTLGAAGAIEGVASVLAIMHQTAPPTIGFDDDAGDSSLDFVPNRARSMPIDTVVSTNYAFGGNNVAVVLRAPDENRPGAELPERDVVITGLGPVTGAGVGIGDFSAVVAGGAVGPDAGVTPQPDLGGRAFAPRTMWRQANTLSKLAIAASRLAWEDAALALRRTELENVGVMYATESGSRESVDDYDDSVLANPNSPAIHSFSNVVLNATGGAVCQALGFRGPTTTVCGGEASATLAMECGIETIRAGKAEVVFVVAADEAAGADRVTGASAIVLESAEHARERGATPYARIVSSRHVGESAGSTAAEEFDRTVAGADLTGLDAVYGDGAELVPGKTSVSTAGVTGRCGSVTGALDVVMAAERIAREGAGTAVVHAYAPGSVRGTVVLGRP
jgi:3-oxoacyl-[acyl-carrier-protein] synthase II